jgi:hypothetical protein
VPLSLPAIITLEQLSGDPNTYLEAVYEIFVQDFVRSRPTYRGKRLNLKCHPFIDGKEYTFYHMTHDGNIETERIPNLRRMERIPWPRPMINYSTDPELKVWRNKRGKHERILIMHDLSDYVVILEDRINYILPWTTIYIDYPNRKRKLLAEYEEYIKTEAAQHN